MYLFKKLLNLHKILQVELQELQGHLQELQGEEQDQDFNPIVPSGYGVFISDSGQPHIMMSTLPPVPPPRTRNRTRATNDTPAVNSRGTVIGMNTRGASARTLPPGVTTRFVGTLSAATTTAATSSSLNQSFQRRGKIFITSTSLRKHVVKKTKGGN